MNNMQSKFVYELINLIKFMEFARALNGSDTDIVFHCPTHTWHRNLERFSLNQSDMNVAVCAKRIHENGFVSSVKFKERNLTKIFSTVKIIF